MLKIERLYKSHQKRPVLQGIDLEIKSGEIYGLLGPNGAGKTTLINIICHLLNADQGQVYIAGQTWRPQHRYLLGISPQKNLLYQSLTCGEHLYFFGRIYGVPERELPRRVKQCLTLVGLASRADSLAENLSGGMQKRLNIAIALIHQPKLLILDEPTASLDIESRFEVWQLIRQCQQQGMTLLLTTHLLEEAERMCDRIGILKQGKLAAEGSLPSLQTLIQAAEILSIQTPTPKVAIERAQSLGWPIRYYHQDLLFWVPETLELNQIIHLFAGISLTSVARQPVRLEHIYLEIMHGDSPPTKIPQLSPGEG
ncbi:Sulfate-transporting ATPase [Gloeomargarita lithophora Alchichica-D10]|uniref:Sulfate-transporting ATPase n=1 Tax=Gloeomargarita lithophora Alchichica-D10 TaxID=1188229 RepID=A0A1J0ADX8_9CYAN|nr:ABC transporter ATP-binding protein [Gloeomargarita lithophora]APB34129.1 Sulfate-transporting ATPase [Gloeomargarita lithophora Alchichica-D10]